MASNLPARTSVDRLLRDEEALPRDDGDEPFLDSDGIARVLRNCYLLLALSLVPTVLGAWVGLSTKLSSVAPRMSPGSKELLHHSYSESFLYGLPLPAIIGFFAIYIAFGFVIDRFKDSPISVGVLLVYTFFMGFLASRLIHHVLGFANGAQLIMIAFGGTALVFGAMAAVATVFKREFSGMEWFLFVLFLILLIAAVGKVVNVHLKVSSLILAISVVSVVFFSVAILFRLQSIVAGGESNYVLAALFVHLSIFYVFWEILTDLSNWFGRDRD